VVLADLQEPHQQCQARAGQAVRRVPAAQPGQAPRSPVQVAPADRLEPLPLYRVQADLVGHRVLQARPQPYPVQAVLRGHLARLGLRLRCLDRLDLRVQPEPHPQSAGRLGPPVLREQQERLRLCRVHPVQRVLPVPVDLVARQGRLQQSAGRLGLPVLLVRPPRYQGQAVPQGQADLADQQALLQLFQAQVAPLGPVARQALHQQYQGQAVLVDQRVRLLL